jgi:hypothetical protein
MQLPEEEIVRGPLQLPDGGISMTTYVISSPGENILKKEVGTPQKLNPQSSFLFIEKKSRKEARS